MLVVARTALLPPRKIPVQTHPRTTKSAEPIMACIVKALRE